MDDFLDFESLKEAAPLPRFMPGDLAVAEPPPDPAAFAPPPPSGTQKLVPGARQRYLARWEAGRQQFEAAVQAHQQREVAYHLLTQARAARAPWGITTAVACLPVLVLGMGAALAHLLRADACGQNQADRGPTSAPRSTGDRQDQAVPAGHGDVTAIRPDQFAAARAVAAQLTATGQQVSRRSLRAAGLRGSNADLGALALATRACVTAAAERGRQPPTGSG